MKQESRERLIGLMLDPGPHVVIGMLGALKAGAGFVPIDPEYPLERITFMLADCGIKTLLTEAKHLGKAHQLAGKNPELKHVVCLDTVQKPAGSGNDVKTYDYRDYVRDGLEPKKVPVERDQLAYVVYTSGSTGRPKGVPITHENLVPMLMWGREYLGLGEHTKTLQSLSYCFDFGIFEVLTTVLFGGALYYLDRGELTDAPIYAQYVNEQQINTINATPSFFMMLAALGTKMETLEILHLGGEELTNRTLDEIFNTVGTKCVVYNGYGPTEATINASIFTVGSRSSRRYRASDSIPIGKVSANNWLYVLGKNYQPLPVGVPGELHVGGVGLARGYLNRPELSAEKFVPHPFSDEPGARLYKTGDLVRYLPDGNIEFLGRQDYQVKIRGFRVELGEIEAALREQPAVREAVVLARGDRPDEKHLVAYVVPRHEPALKIGDLRDALQTQLPDYMVPSAFVLLDTLPLTPNGKVDRRALPTPEEVALDTTGMLVMPRDALELRLVQIWEDVLGVQPIGVRHNFFELGGHSLLAVRLMARIQRELGQQLSLATLFQGATVEQLATIVRQHEKDVGPLSSLVPMYVGKSNKRPLFFVHPTGGNVLCYADLVRHLGPDRPFYGLQSRGLEGERAPYTDIETMASHYVELLGTVQPKGPYLLGGWSLGGVVAFEMARQLRAQGEEVGLLALVDSYAPRGEPQVEPDDATLLVSFALDMGLDVDRIQFDLDHLAQLVPDERLGYVLEEAKRASVVPPDIGLAQVRHLFHVFKSNVLASRQYVPSAYEGPVVLFRAGESSTEAGADLGWSALAAGGVTVQVVPGNHYEIVREPNVQTLGEALKHHLYIFEAEKKET